MMVNHKYKKMAGTSAVFISTQYAQASPVERDGMVWLADELHLEGLPVNRQKKPSMSTVLALEGLEDYDAPENGDVRRVDSMNIDFVYFEKIHGWIQVMGNAPELV